VVAQAPAAAKQETPKMKRAKKKTDENAAGPRNGALGPLLQTMAAPPAVAPRDWRLYDPFAKRPSPLVKRPSRNRVRPIAYWAGEKPVYSQRVSSDNLPRLLGYGRERPTPKAQAELPPKLRKMRQMKR
jgi:hypothetical protein